jgi:hypothetical protein
MMLRIDIHHWFARVAILNLNGRQNTQILIWAKFGFQVDYGVAN